MSERQTSGLDFGWSRTGEGRGEGEWAKRVERRKGNGRGVGGRREGRMEEDVQIQQSANPDLSISFFESAFPFVADEAA